MPKRASIIAVVLLIAASGLTWWNTEFFAGSHFCQKCAVRSFERSVTAFGMTIRRTRTIDATPVSRLIAGQIEQPCRHDWRFDDGCWGPYGYAACGHGRGFSWYVPSGHPLDTSFAIALHRAQEADPEFANRIVAALRSEDVDAYHREVLWAREHFEPSGTP